MNEATRDALRLTGQALIAAADRKQIQWRNASDSKWMDFRSDIWPSDFRNIGAVFYRPNPETSKLQWEEVAVGSSGNTIWTAYSPRDKAPGDKAIFGIEPVLLQNSVHWKECGDKEVIIGNPPRIWGALDEAKNAIQDFNDFILSDRRRRK